VPPRRDGIPAIIDAAGRAERLERVSLGEKEISEGWLQQRLLECPELLPIDEIDPGFGPLIAVGCEVGTAVGPMDNLYISAQGTLTLVEAKLWRNPEARRQVIGQILDYAKELSRWSYDDLDAKAREVAGKSLWELVSGADNAGLDESRFVDAVARNLKVGRFLLLIVGDGIREEMERLADFLQETPQLRFTLALVELQVYRLPNDERYLILPLIVGRTKEITRAVVRVASSDGAQVDVSLEIVDDSGDEAGKKRRTLTQDEFFAGLANAGTSIEGVNVAQQLYDRFDSDDRFQIDLGAASYSIKLRDPLERSQLYTVIVVESVGRVYVGWLDSQLSRVGLPVSIGEQFVAKAATLFGCQLNARYATSWNRPVDLKTVAAKRDEFVTLIEEFATAVYSARERTGS
jgi:hypothetical protein